MKIAFTADCHLTTLTKNPERFQSLANIFQQCGEKQVQLLIIAGDLFDKSMANYAEFEEIYRQYRPPELKTVLIPGNHDQGIQQGCFAVDGLRVYSEPTLQPLFESRKILFTPFQQTRTMGETIAPFADQLAGVRWILVGHGNWSAGRNTADPYEPGIYMPLTSTDLNLYQPELVILGHIHLPQESSLVHYPGSPCPINITETGLRQFLILDTAKGEISSQLVDTPLVYFNEQFSMIPSENDLNYLINDMTERIKGWHLPPDWENRVQVRVKLTGFAYSDRRSILTKIKKTFSGYAFYPGNQPDLSELYHSRDPDRAEIAAQLQTWVKNLDWLENPLNPTKADILQEALKVIYGTS